MPDLILEFNALHTDHQPTLAGVVMFTPDIDESYWRFRVRLSDTQAIVGFSKFGTVGIGFAQEEDWNTNLPYSVGTEKIYTHIRKNKGDDSITQADAIRAIEMVQAAARDWMATR